MPSATATGSVKAVDTKLPLSPEELQKVHAYWRAANYLSVGQIYLYDNPLLPEPLRLKHIKPRLLGHWGTTPGLNFIYVHLNRLIKKLDLNVVYVAGPGHGGPGLVANTYLERPASSASSAPRFRGEGSLGPNFRRRSSASCWLKPAAGPRRPEVAAELIGGRIPFRAR
jgi:phosphoketolase